MKKVKKYIVKSWHLMEKEFKTKQQAKEEAEQLKKFSFRKDIEIIELEEISRKIL